MKAKFSALALHSFELLECHFSFNVPKEDEIEISSLFKSYSVNIDFNHIFRDENKIQLFVKIEVNYLKKPKPGYSLMTEGMGMFEINKTDELSDNLLDNLKYYSTLNMMINNLRNIMFQTSNVGPIGGYLLPPVDILDLFKKKKRQVQRKKVE